MSNLILESVSADAELRIRRQVRCVPTRRCHIVRRRTERDDDQGTGLVLCLDGLIEDYDVKSAL